MKAKLIFASLSGIGAIGGGVGSYYFFKSKPINAPKIQKITLEEAIKGDDFVALNTLGREDDATWKKLIEKYNSNDITKKIVVENITTSSNDDNAENIKKLQSACQVLLSKKENYENHKETAKNWCNKKSKLISSENH